MRRFPRQPSRHFPAIKSGVSLKRESIRAYQAFPYRFPRDQKRGLIEATISTPDPVTRMLFPRDQKRGLIEARSGIGRCGTGSTRFPRDQKRGLIEAGMRAGCTAPCPDFPAIKSGVSLKHAGIAACWSRRANFPAIKSGVSLKQEHPVPRQGGRQYFPAIKSGVSLKQSENQN